MAELIPLANLKGADSTVPGPPGPNTVPTTTAVRSTVTGDIATPDSEIAVALNAKYGPPVIPLNAFDNFFGGAGRVFVTGQATASTTLTSGTAAGATVLPFASVTGITAGVAILTGAGTATQQVNVVASVAGNNVTLSTPVTVALASGATVGPLWTNPSHLTTEGWAAFAYFIATAKDAAGNYVIGGTAPKVTFLGDSWFANGGTIYATKINARIPSATVVNAGVSGNRSSDMIARFNTDVPADSDYVVINEPGVNDVYNSLFNQKSLADNLETLVALIRGIGATPVFTGMVPLADLPVKTALMNRLLAGQTKAGEPKIGMSALLDVVLYGPSTNSMGMGLGVQAYTTGVNNTAYGYYAQGAQTTGSKNTAFGSLVQTSLTTGQSNTAIGDSSQLPLTTGSNNTALGQSTQRALTIGGGNTAIGQGSQNALIGGNFNTALGQNAQLALTSGSSNVAVGQSSMYAPNNAAANAHTTATGGTAVGHQSGLASTTQADYITAIGYRAIVTAAGGVAIGTDSGGNGAVAVAANDIALGTAQHKVKILGRLTVAPRTPSGSADPQGTVGDITSDDSYLYAKTSTGWKRAALTAW